MAKKKTRKDENAESYLENPEAIAEQLSRTEQFIEDNKVLVIGITTVIVLIIAGFFGYNYYKSQQEELAQGEMFQAIYYFESDSLDLAINGDGNALGFKDIADEYSITQAGKLANYYAGAAYLKQEKYKLALLYLELFSSDDLLIQARTYSLMGDAHMGLEEYTEAAELYMQAANYKPNEQFSPTYLMKAAIAYEKAGDMESAKEAYGTIVDDYKSSTEYQKAQKLLARLGS